MHGPHPILNLFLLENMVRDRHSYAAYLSMHIIFFQRLYEYAPHLAWFQAPFSLV